MSLASIRKRALNGTLEVEHLLAEAKVADPGLPALLSELSAQLNWSPTQLLPDGARAVPLGSWAKVVSAYVEGGFQDLLPLVASAATAPLVLGLLEELKTAESLSFLLDAYAINLRKPARDLNLSFRVASALNLMLSFKPAAAYVRSQAASIQEFLILLHGIARNEAERALALLALRGVGNAEAIFFVKSVSPLESPWAEVPGTVVRSINKRLGADVP